MTRQQVYQLKMRAAGKCAICGQPRATPGTPEPSRWYCLKHAAYQQEYQRRRKGCKKRFTRCASYGALAQNGGAA
jgi:hypothetical protein